MQKEYFKDIQTWKVQLNSVQELYDNQVLTADGGKAEYERLLFEFSSGNRDHWRGCSAVEVRKRRFGWEEGSDRAKKMAEMGFLPRSDKFQKNWSDDDGDDGDMERYLMEMPFLIRRKKRFADSALKTAVMKVRIAIDENAGTPAEDMLWKTVTAVRVVDELESLNIRCEIWAETHQQRMNRDGSSFQMKVLVKETGEPVNLSLLANVLSPWFFRYEFFLFERANFDTCGSLGQSTTTGADGGEAEIIINQGRCLSQEEGNRFIKDIEKRFNEKNW